MENDKTLSDFFKLISEAKSEQNSNSITETVQPQEENSLIQASLGVLKSKNQIIEQAPPTEFVTHEEMKTHYIGFLNSIQKQMSTIGGGGYRCSSETGRISRNGFRPVGTICRN